MHFFPPQSLQNTKTICGKHLHIKVNVILIDDFACPHVKVIVILILLIFACPHVNMKRLP